MDNIFSKRTLQIGLIAYIISLLISILNNFINNFPIQIPGFSIISLILFAYVYDRGDNIGKYGIIVLLADFFVDVAKTVNNALDCYLSSCFRLYKIFSVLGTFTSGLLTVLSIIALFSLIESRDSKVESLKSFTIILAILCYIFSIIIDLSSLNKAGFIYKLYYSFISIRNYLEYIVIIVYLLAKLPTQLSTQANNKENVPVSPNNSNPNFMQQPKFTINNPNPYPVK